MAHRYWLMLSMAAIAADESNQQVKLKDSLQGVGHTLLALAHANVSYLHTL